jgi:2-C-methyl-D-erythritol 4-phosphate cytidylyltransferase
MTSAIIVAAGSSQRMGFDKLFADLGGEPVLLRSVRAFEACSGIQEIILVVQESQRSRVTALIHWGQCKKVRAVVSGGTTRHHSVAHGLAALNPATQLIAIHDGARPMVAQVDIEKVLVRARETGAASLAHPVVETLKRVDDQGRIVGPVERQGLWAMETPQVFGADLLRRASAAVVGQAAEITDEVTAVERLGITVHAVAATQPNPKITYPSDVEMVKKLIRG